MTNRPSNHGRSFSVETKKTSKFIASNKIRQKSNKNGFLEAKLEDKIKNSIIEQHEIYNNIFNDTCYENVEKLRRNYKLKHYKIEENFPEMKENCSYLKNSSKSRILFIIK